MSAKWQRIKVQIPKGYKPIERESIAQDIIDFMVKRTLKGKDKNNKKFTPGYSEEYAESRVGKIAGKRKGATPNLKLSGDMIEALGEYRKHKKGEISIGYESGGEQNAKADGNIRGTYGKSAPVTKGRDFLGISKKDLKAILKNYPLKGEGSDVERLKSIIQNLSSKTQAKQLASTIDKDLGEFIDQNFD